jgi:ATP-dependent DNA ligase
MKGTCARWHSRSRSRLPLAMRQGPEVDADVSRPPPGEGWLHEPKWDGYRFQIVQAGDQVRLAYSGARMRKGLAAHRQGHDQ